MSSLASNADSTLSSRRARQVVALKMPGAHFDAVTAAEHAGAHVPHHPVRLDRAGARQFFQAERDFIDQHDVQWIALPHHLRSYAGARIEGQLARHGFV